MDAGFADPTAIGCAARSYGGYLTVAAMARYPALFQVGVDVRGIVEFETFFAHTEPWIAAAAVSRYGDPQQDAAQVRPSWTGGGFPRPSPSGHCSEGPINSHSAQSARPLANSRPGRGGHW